MKPMLCQPATLAEAREMVQKKNCIIEEKFDGVRAYIERGKLYNRRGEEMTVKFPEFVGIEKLDGYDGEVVCASGEFSDVQSRVHTKSPFYIKLFAQKMPAYFVVFDAPSRAPLRRRKALLDGAVLPAWMRRAPAYPTVDAAWEHITANGGEGIVVKDADATYEEGKRSASWIKVKAFAETTAVFTKLEQHAKGVRLETDDGRAVNVNGQQAEYVKFKFNNDGKVCCEVQYMPQKDSEAWRFPSFRGVVESSPAQGGGNI